MRCSYLLLLAALICANGVAQTDSHYDVAPVPADPHELVTGAVQIASTPADRASVLSMLERARQNADMHMPGTPPFLIKMSFTSSGTAYLGGGEMDELWLSGRHWRYDQSLGSYSESRIGSNGRMFAQVSGSVPMRVLMLRSAMFWPVGTATSGNMIRSASAQWNNRPVTCVLASGSTFDGPGRHWGETEHCVDNASGLLQIYSRAPGTFVVYGYSKGVVFHGRSVPDQMSIFVAGNSVVEAQLVSIEDTSADEASLAPTSSMVPVTHNQANMRFPVDPNGAPKGVEKPVIVHVVIDKKGSVAEEEFSAAADPSLAPSALDFVKNMQFGPGPAEREAYIRVRYSAPK